MRKEVSDFVRWLKGADLSVEERNLCTGILLDKLEAVPLGAIISTNDAGEILINGKEQDIEKLTDLREYAIAAVQNKALQLVWEQVRWTAFRDGLASGHPDTVLQFYRAALWFSDSLKQQLALLAGSQELPLSED